MRPWPEAGAIGLRTFAVLTTSFLLAATAPRADDSTAAPDPGARSSDPTALVDAMIGAAWQEAKLRPSPVAPDGEFIRRVYLDLLGRIPSAQDAAEFLASRDRDKRTRLVEKLLDHPDYPKRMASLWTITLVGRKGLDNRADRTALETWLRRQFAENRPWNEVVYDLVTATGSNKENGAANFTLAHMDDGAVNLTSITTRAFLGQQIQCTQCHDHPSNNWKQADFWGINAFFKGISAEEVERVDATGATVYDHTVLSDEPTDAYATYERRNALVEIAFPKYLDGRKISQGPDVVRRQALARFITEQDNLQLARAYVNRMWGLLMGRGFVQPVDDFGDHNPPSHPELLDRLAEEFRASGYDTRALIRWITASRAYNLTSVMLKDNQKDEAFFSHMLMKPMSPEQLFDSLLVATEAHKVGGDARQDERRREWLRQFVVVFGNDEDEETTLFQGTIPQTLMMMNGDLMARATGGQPGSFLARLRDQAVSQRRQRPEACMVNGMYLAALSRYPTPAEMNRAAAFLTSSPDTLPILEDLFWALLNSNEFILNH
jgi:hypothetical protein